MHQKNEIVAFNCPGSWIGLEQVVAAEHEEEEQQMDLAILAELHPEVVMIVPEVIDAAIVEEWSAYG